MGCSCLFRFFFIPRCSLCLLLRPSVFVILLAVKQGPSDFFHFSLCHQCDLCGCNFFARLHACGCLRASLLASLLHSCVAALCSRDPLAKHCVHLEIICSMASRVFFASAYASLALVNGEQLPPGWFACECFMRLSCDAVYALLSAVFCAILLQESSVSSKLSFFFALMNAFYSFHFLSVFSLAANDFFLCFSWRILKHCSEVRIAIELAATWSINSSPELITCLTCVH